MDASPLSVVTNPKATDLNEDCRRRLAGVLDGGTLVVIPEIADYEVRRELLRGNKSAGLRRLDALKNDPTFLYLPLTTAVMLQAAAFWATARQRGTPTSDNKELDCDVILAAQAHLFRRGNDRLVVATSNPSHLRQFVTAEQWQDIPAYE